MISFDEDRPDEHKDSRELPDSVEHRFSPALINYLLGSIALVWLIGVISLYFVNHKPFSPDQALSILKGAAESFAEMGMVSWVDKTRAILNKL